MVYLISFSILEQKEAINKRFGANLTLKRDGGMSVYILDLQTVASKQ